MRVQQLFAEVVGLDDERRSARLERIEDSGIRREVQTLLDRHARGEAFSSEAVPRPSEAEEHEVVGCYRLLGELGRGAMGVVYRAEDTRLGRPVALKFLSPELSADERARARLKREARAASALDHPNICTVYEIGETDDGRLFLALACYEGETLERRIDRGPLEVEEAVRTAVHVARGLAAAHRHGIVHRDVKPSNVLVTDERAVKLLDFGIARVADSELTGSGDVLGTVAYMSPEQLRGEVDARVDVWALGVVLYEMLTGHRPFRGDYEAALLYAVLHEDPAPLDRDDVPEELAEIVRRCLEKDPDDRYQSAEEVEVALERLGLGSASVPPVRRALRRKRSLVLGGGTALVALLVLVSPLRTGAMDWLGLGGTPDLNHLAILPFESRAIETSVGDGLVQELTRRLTLLGGQADPPVKVVAKTELGAVETPEAAFTSFGVEAVIRGTLRRSDERDELVLELVDTRSARVLQTTTLTEPRGRLSVLQRRALGAVAEMVEIPLSEAEFEALDVGGTADSEALSFYWSAIDYLGRFDMPENIGTAIVLFHRALEQDSLYAAAHAGLSDAHRHYYNATRDPNEIRLAEQHARRAVTIADEFASGHVALGNVYALRGRYSEAIREHNVALELNPLDASAHVGLANSLQAVGRYENAEDSFERAIHLQPSVWSHHNQLGRLYLASGEIDKSAAKFMEVIEAAPDNAWGHANLSGAYLYLGEIEKARASAERANRIQPTASAYSNLGTIAYYKGDTSEEARMYRQALALDSTNYMLWGNLGGAYKRMGSAEDLVRSTYERAIDLVERALVVNPRSPELLCDLSGYAVHTGDRERAIRSAEQAAALAPNDATVLAQVGRVFEYLKEREEALRWIERALRAGYPLEELEADPDLDDLRKDHRYVELSNKDEPL